MNSMSLKTTSVLLFKALTLAICLGVTVTSRAYDFSAPTASGHTLYFHIIDNTQHYVETTYPFVSGTDITGNYITGNLVIPDTVFYGGETWIVRAVGQATFMNCPGMTSCVLPETVVAISGYNAFGLCSSMTSVTLPASLTSIGPYAFHDCDALQEVHFTGTAEQWCKINFINWDANPLWKAHTLIINGDTVRDLVLQEGLDTIHFHAFLGCNLRSISIPRSVRMIDAHAFKCCDSLTTVYYNADSCGSHNFGVTEPIFVNCPRLANFIFGDHVVHIPHYLCTGLLGIDTIWLPAGLRSIAEGAFSGCSNLRHVDFFHTQLDSIASGAFYRTALEKVVLPRSCTYIGNGAFRDNNSLRYVCIMARNFTWGSGVFSDCPNIDTLRMYAPAPPTLTSVLPNTVHLIIPCGAGDYYAQETPGVLYNWNVINDVEEMSDVTVIVGATEGGVASVLREPTCLNMSAEIMAVADSGWHFILWSDGDTNNPRTLTVTSDTAIVAYFASANGVVYFHDTVLIHDTTFVPVHDTTYLPVHDTTVVTEYIHDTTIVTVHDTTYMPVHDTTVVTEYIHDTTIVTVHDTTYLPVHDTTVVTQYIHDTTTVYVEVHDTVWLTEYIHDTVYVHDTIIVGVDEVDVINAKVYSNNGQIVVEGADGNTVTLYDLTGRYLTTKQDYGTAIRFDVPASGTYMIKIGNHASRKVVVIR